ncbi:hypothetical protein LR48_Vigan11g111200 [Vigna angularis]|uniref:GRF-type domain-containing protein n=2 Tax=Phaseolus angularis TaxID=3914 RepID=A0A0L9VT11_PHAAN|nr:hypothetical protein LR48_Vigan11g111200 [Vigna angularis]
MENSSLIVSNLRKYCCCLLCLWFVFGDWGCFVGVDEALLCHNETMPMNHYSSFSWGSSRGVSSRGMVGSQICYCGDLAVLRVAKTSKNEGKPFWGCPNYKNLLSLEEMLNQYILMKRQNKLLEEENVNVMREKIRIQNLLQDLQNALDSFNARSPMSNVTAMITNSVIVPPMENFIKTPPVASTSTVFPVQNTPSLPAKPMANVNFSSPMIREFEKKRKDISTVDGSVVAKKRRGRQPGKKKQVQCTNMLLPSNNKADFGFSSTLTQSLAANPTHKESQISTDSVSTTHPIIHSFPSVFVPEISPVAKCNEKVIDVVTTKRDMVDHVKQTFCKEGNSQFSPVVTDNHETHKTDTNKISMKDTDKKSTTALDEFDDCTHIDFSSIKLEDEFSIDFLNSLKD